MAKNKVKYPTMPRNIIKVGQGFKNMCTGEWLSDKQIEAYTTPKQEVKEHKLSHSEIIEKRWDLRNDY